MDNDFQAKEIKDELKKTKSSQMIRDHMKELRETKTRRQRSIPANCSA
jgi:hypothetical protein